MRNFVIQVSALIAVALVVFIIAYAMPVKEGDSTRSVLMVFSAICVGLFGALLVVGVKGGLVGDKQSSNRYYWSGKPKGTEGWDDDGSEGYEPPRGTAPVPAGLRPPPSRRIGMLEYEQEDGETEPVRITLPIRRLRRAG